VSILRLAVFSCCSFEIAYIQFTALSSICFVISSVSAVEKAFSDAMEAVIKQARIREKIMANSLDLTLTGKPTNFSCISFSVSQVRTNDRKELV
jgi:hypothetical protein